jgi:hypothetical protein
MNEIERRRRRREKGKPMVWIAVFAIGIGVSALFLVLISRGGSGAAPAAAVAPAKKPPRPPDCDDVSERAGRRHSAKVGDVTLTWCRDDGWSADVRTCLVKATSNEAYDACLDKLAPNQMKHLAVATAPAELSGGVAPKNVDTGCSFAADAWSKLLVETTLAGAGSNKPFIEPHVERMRTYQWNALAVSCTQDKWPEEAVDCIRRLTLGETAKECLARLPRGARDRFDKEVSTVMDDFAAAIRGTASSAGPPRAP